MDNCISKEYVQIVNDINTFHATDVARYSLLRCMEYGSKFHYDNTFFPYYRYETVSVHALILS